MDEDGTVLRTGVCGADEPVLAGALSPGFVNKPREEKVRNLRDAMDLMWERGVSAMADISNCDDSFAVKAEHPMYTRTFLEVFGTEPEDCAGVMEGVLALQEKARAYGLDAAPTPHACYTMSPELVTASSAEGLKSGFLSFHSEETEEEEEMVRKGSGPMWENRRAAGMEHILLVHEVCMDQEGIDAVKAVMDHPYIALCPLSNIYIHNALPPVPLMRRNGLTLCVGTDSLSSNDDLDMVKELFCLQENFEGLSLGELLTWACRNGADFLARPELGALVPGKRPGLVLIDHLGTEGQLTCSSRSQRLI